MGNGIYVEDIDMVRMFIKNWTQGLDMLEKEILRLELQEEDPELVNHMDQIIHNIKGEASFAGLTSMIKVSYAIEITIAAMIHGSVIVSKELTDHLLLAVGFLKAYSSKLEEVVKNQDISGENGTQYLKLDSDQSEEQIIDGLKLAIENGKGTTEAVEDRVSREEISGEELGLSVLDSEEFKRELSEGMKEQFLIENAEHIERVENDYLIRLDSNSEDKEAMNEIFRAVHSIKGGAGIYLATLPSQSEIYSALKKFSEVVHTFESLLSIIRDKEHKFNKNLVDLSLLVMDYLNSFIRAVELDEFNDLEDKRILDLIHREMSNNHTIHDSKVQNNPIVPPKIASKPEDIKSKGNVSQSIRVSQEKLDKMMNMISELLIVKNSFMHLSSKLRLEYDLPEISKELKQVGANVNRISDDLQNSIMSIRMVEIRTVFQKMPRVIRDIAQSTGKKMELYMEGESTEIDKTIIEQISDPLVHLIRNSADHGIETIEERQRVEKSETGKIILRAYNKNKHVFIEIEDDGKGIDPEKLKTKAIEKGMITDTEAEKMNKNQLINLIFLPGFSMAKKVTEVSGRGVGMDIVKSNISKINGKITIESEVGKGTKMIIQLPLTLAVSHGLVVEAAKENYIIPLEYIVETVKFSKTNLHKFNGKYYTHLRGEVIGIEWLSEIFSIGNRDTREEEINAVILSSGVENYAIVVDKLKNEQEFVVKTLEGPLEFIPGISGSTLLGNGKVVLIVNPVDLLSLMEK